MNRQDIIHLAKKARFEECWFLAMSPQFFDRLENFAALVAAAEREACAEACESDDWNVAAAIVRARRNK